MKTPILILFILSFLFLLHAQENKVNESSFSEKWGVEYDKNNLENLYPDSEFKDSPIKGVWVEQNKKTDSLFFYPYFDGREPILNLKRGLDKSTNLPKQNSGSYNYKLDDRFIKVQWVLSSLILYEPYFIQISNDSSEMKMGNFYGSQSQKNDTLTFKRIDNRDSH